MGHEYSPANMRAMFPHVGQLVALDGSERCNQSIELSQECSYWEPVKKSDLEIGSPYNTYKYRGLPSEPICNPGLASIEAVIYPQETDYWFYLSDEQGRIHYAKTDEEHEENIERYLR